MLFFCLFFGLVDLGLQDLRSSLSLNHFLPNHAITTFFLGKFFAYYGVYNLFAKSFRPFMEQSTSLLVKRMVDFLGGTPGPF